MLRLSPGIGKFLNPVEKRKFGRNPLGLALLASLAIHIGILLFQLVTQHPTELAQEPAPIEITQVPPSQMPPMPPQPTQKPPKPKIEDPQMAESEDAKNRKEDPNAKILSDKTQTAEKQMKAKQIDDFRKAEGKGLKSDSTKQKLSSIAPTGDKTGGKAKKTPLEKGEGETPAEKQEDQKVAGIKRNWKTLSMKDLSVGADGMPSGATDDHLNVQEGDRTILSTREYRYFSYYHRIKELLRQYWKPNVEHRLYKMYERGKQVGEDEMVTKVLVLLNPEGRIEKISRVGSSGFTDLDEAAIEAFERAAPFPNPPKGIIDPDGFVRIRWDFILKTEAAPRIQFQTAGGSPPPP